MLDDLLIMKDVQGEVRFTVHHAFERPQISTFIYMKQGILMSLFVDGFGLWEAIHFDSDQEDWFDEIEVFIPWLSHQIASFRFPSAARSVVESLQLDKSR